MPLLNLQLPYLHEFIIAVMSFRWSLLINCPMFCEGEGLIELPFIVTSDKLNLQLSLYVNNIFQPCKLCLIFSGFLTMLVFHLSSLLSAVHMIHMIFHTWYISLSSSHLPLVSYRLKKWSALSWKSTAPAL